MLLGNIHSLETYRFTVSTGLAHTRKDTEQPVNTLQKKLSFRAITCRYHPWGLGGQVSTSSGSSGIARCAAHTAGVVATHRAHSHSLLERRELGVVLLRNRHVLPWLRISRREALEVRGVYGFEAPSTIFMIAGVGFPRVPLWTNHGAILGERKDVWPGRPHGIE